MTMRVSDFITVDTSVDAYKNLTKQQQEQIKSYRAKNGCLSFHSCAIKLGLVKEYVHSFYIYLNSDLQGA